MGLLCTTGEAHLVQADTLELNAAVGRARSNSFDRQQAIGAFPCLLAVGSKAGVVLTHSAVLCC